MIPALDASALDAALKEIEDEKRDFDESHEHKDARWRCSSCHRAIGTGHGSTCERIAQADALALARQRLQRLEQIETAGRALITTIEQRGGLYPLLNLREFEALRALLDDPQERTTDGRE